jgi:signal transduction histidine kinase
VRIALMLNGVVVDDLTGHFLQIATDRGQGPDLARTLRGFFHDVRNRLNSLKIGLYVARRGASPTQGKVWEELDLSYRGLEQLVDRLQTICRPLQLTPVSGDLGHWLEERRAYWTSRLGASGRRLDWAPPPGPAVGWFDPMRMIQGVDALTAWRAGEGGSDDPVRLAWGSDSSRFHIEWSEDGPSVAEPLEGRDGRAVSMALPLLAHIMTAHGGTVAVSKRPGLVVRLAWPLAWAGIGEGPA